METVAIYCRLSDEDKNKDNKLDDSESIQNQKRMLTDFAIHQGWLIYKVYSDDDYSGLDSNRPKFNQMLCDAEAGKFNIVLCKSQSRFTRDMELVEKYLHHKFVEWGVRFVSIVDNVDTAIKGNKKARQIYGLINEWYCEDLSDSIRAVFKSKMKDGQFVGAFTSYGYKKDPNDRHKIIIDDVAAQVVKQIYDWYLEGFGTYQIGRKLDEQGVVTPSTYKRQQGLNYKNATNHLYGKWSHGTIVKILKNPIYLGYLMQGRESKPSYKSTKRVTKPKEEWIVIPNNHPPIITKDMFDNVQKLLSASRREGKQDAKAHLFAGRIKCMDCGATMTKYVTHAKGEQYQYAYLRCKRAMLSKSKECTLHTVKLAALIKVAEEQVRKLLKDLLSIDENRAMLKKAFVEKQNNQEKTSALERELIHLQQKLMEQAEIIKNLYTDKARGIISEETYLALYQTFSKEQIEIKKRGEFVQKALEREAQTTVQQDDFEQALQNFYHFEVLTHEMVNVLIDAIEIGEKDEEGRQIVRLYWQF